MAQPTATQSNPQTERYLKFVHNFAIAAVITCPILALLPPRKLDFYTLGLVGVTGYSTNYLIRESSGRSIWQHVSRTGPAIVADGKGASEELKVERAKWKVERAKEIQDDVDVGKGFGEMITDQIWEVWNQGKTKEEDE